MGFSQGAKKDKPGIKFVPESGLRSATSWPILVSVNSLGTSVQGSWGSQVSRGSPGVRILPGDFRAGGSGGLR